MDATSKTSADADENSEVRSSNTLIIRGKKDDKDLMRVVVAILLGDPSLAITSLLNWLT